MAVKRRSRKSSSANNVKNNVFLCKKCKKSIVVQPGICYCCEVKVKNANEIITRSKSSEITSGQTSANTVTTKCKHCDDFRLVLSAKVSEIDKLKRTIDVLEKQLQNRTCKSQQTELQLDLGVISSTDRPNENKEKTTVAISTKNSNVSDGYTGNANEDSTYDITLKLTSMVTDKHEEQQKLCAVHFSRDNQRTSVDTSTVRKNERKVLIFADSHGRKLAEKVSDIQTDWSVQAVVKPGAGVKEITKTVVKSCKNLGSRDSVVICAGANDVARNEGNEFITILENICSKLGNTNVAVVNQPWRYDLPAWSCVNKLVERVNRKTDELCTKFPNVNLIDVSKLERTMHTTHGLHLNYWGKQFLAEEICNLVNTDRKRHGLETVQTTLDKWIIKMDQMASRNKYVTEKSYTGQIHTSSMERCAKAAVQMTLPAEEIGYARIAPEATARTTATTSASLSAEGRSAHPGRRVPRQPSHLNDFLLTKAPAPTAPNQQNLN